MSGGPTGLHDAAVELLRAAADALEASPAGAISRCYVSPGAPAWDRPDQLTVHAGGPAAADTAPLSPPLASGHRVQTAGNVWLAPLTITVLRRVPVTGQTSRSVPSVEALEKAAAAANGDVWSIWNHLATAKRAGRLFAAEDGSATTREMILDAALSVVTEGGVCGWQIPIRVALPGYRTGGPVAV